MKIMIESTQKIVELVTPDGTVPARIWEGQTDTGIRVHAYVTRVAVAQGENQEQFQRDLQEQRAPSQEVAAIPLRLIL